MYPTTERVQQKLAAVNAGKNEVETEMVNGAPRQCLCETKSNMSNLVSLPPRAPAAIVRDVEIRRMVRVKNADITTGKYARPFTAMKLPGVMD
jgi:hypothetical protein